MDDDRDGMRDDIARPAEYAKGSAGARYGFRRFFQFGGRAFGLHVARGYRERLLGLMGTDSMPSGCALAFPGCTSIHTCFMRYSIDLVWYGGVANGERVVLRVDEHVAPWRFALAPHGCEGVLEVAAGEAGDITRIGLF